MKALDDFIAQVLDREPECTAEDIADMVWLARYLPAATKATVKRAPTTDQKPPENLGLSLLELDKTGVQPSKPQLPPSPVSSPPSAPIVSGPDSQPAQQRVRVSAAPGLEQVLQIAGSLRPLRRLAPSRFDSVIDYEQTARRSADENIWVPVLRPKLDRALSLALVLDQASSMSLWRPLVRDLRRLLVERGNFRQCRLWSLHTDSDSKPVLTAGWQAHTNQISRDPREVLAPGGQLVIVVSDCIAPAWYRSDMLSTLLEPWGRHSHLVVFNPLGEYLWPRTRLGLATPVQLSAPFPAASNINLRIHEFDLLETTASTGLKLPVVELAPPQTTTVGKNGDGQGGYDGFGIHIERRRCRLIPVAGSCRPGRASAGTNPGCLLAGGIPAGAPFVESAGDDANTRQFAHAASAALCFSAAVPAYA